MSHLCDTTGQVFVPLRAVAFPSCCVLVAVISRADEVFTGIYSLAFRWNQPEGDRKGLIGVDSAGSVPFRNKTGRWEGQVSRKIPEGWTSRRCHAGLGHCRFSSWVNLYQESQSLVSLGVL